MSDGLTHLNNQGQANMVDVTGRDVTGDIHAVKARRIEALDVRIKRPNGLLHALHLLVDQGVTAD